VAIFTTNVDAENQTLINHKCVCGALNRHFCQTRVQAKPFVSLRVAYRLKATYKTMIVSPLKQKNHEKIQSKIGRSIALLQKVMEVLWQSISFV